MSEEQKDRITASEAVFSTALPAEGMQGSSVSTTQEAGGGEDEKVSTAPVLEEEPQAAAAAAAAAEAARIREGTSPDGSMSVVQHLEELRKRLIRSLIAVGLCSGVAYYFVEDIVHILTKPAGKLYYMQPAEAFFTYIKVAVFGGFLMALPIVFYQLWKFFLPALTIRERKIIALVVPASVFLFFAGLAFAFFLVLPLAINFFMGYTTDDLQAMFSIKQYFDFAVGFLLPFGFVFELPLIIVILAKLGLVSSAFLGKHRRVVIFLSFVIGAIVTPPDVFSQVMIAIPVVLLYESSYLLVRYVLRR